MTLPSYVLSCFRFSKKLGKEIKNFIANFWWGDLEGRRIMYWIGWNQLSNSKELGGLGFKDIECTNSALLAKQIWRIIIRPDSLLSRVLKAKYFEKESILKAKTLKNSSWFWQSIISAKEVIQNNIIKGVRNGKSIKVWLDSLIPFNENGKVQYEKPPNCQVLTAIHLIEDTF